MSGEMPRSRDRTRKKRGGNPNRPSQIARERAGLTSARDYESAFAGRDEQGVLYHRRASEVSAEHSAPVPLAPPANPPSGVGKGSWRLAWVWQEEEEGPGSEVRTVVTSSEVRSIPPPRSSRRPRSPIPRSSVPEAAHSPKRPVDPEHPPKRANEPDHPAERAPGPKRSRKLIDLPKSVVKIPKTTEKADSPEPVIESSGPSSGSRPYITPAKVRGSYSAPKRTAFPERRGTGEATVPKRRGSGEAASPTRRGPVDAPVTSKPPRKDEERPLIALDWHKTLSFESLVEKPEDHGVAERSAEIIRDLQERGYDFCVISFASSTETQRKVQRKASQFECELLRPFTSIDVVNRKFTKDPEKKPSISGLITSKAQQVSLRGAFAFVDDQVDLLREVEELQSGRAVKHRCVCMKSEPYARSSLFKLAAFLQHKTPQECPPPSLLINICSEALKLFASGRLKKKGG